MVSMWIMGIVVLAALGLGAFLSFVMLKGKSARLVAQVQYLEPYKVAYEDAKDKLHAQAIAFEREKATLGAQLASLAQAKEQMGQSFQALCAQALEQNNRVFLELAQGNFSKLHETLFYSFSLFNDKFNFSKRLSSQG